MHAPTLLLAALVSIVSAGGHGYSNSTISSTSSHAVTSSSSLSSSSSSYSHSSKPTSSSASLTSSSKLSSSTSVTSLTTYTTVTTCPITYTHYSGSSIAYSTGYTTSTLTVTSCKGGCTPPPPPPQKPTPPPTKPSQPAGPVTVTDTITKFVPCSTPVTDSTGKTIYYSTWLTATYIPTTYVTTYTAIPPPPPVKSATVCPPEKTVTETVYVTVGVPSNPTPPAGGPGGNSGKPETSTKVETHSGKPETTTKSAPSSTKTYVPPSGTGSGPKPPQGTGSGPKSSDSKTWTFPSPSATKKW